MIHPGQAAIVNDGGGVVDVVGAVHEAHHSGDGAGPLDDLLEAVQIGPDEIGLEQEVFGGIAGDGQLREGNQVHTKFPRLANVVQDFLRIARQVPNRGVNLCQPYPQSSHLFLLSIPTFFKCDGVAMSQPPRHCTERFPR